MLCGCSRLGPNAVLTCVIALLLNALKKSNCGRTIILPNLKSRDTAKSTWLTRSRNTVPGSLSGVTLTVVCVKPGAIALPTEY